MLNNHLSKVNTKCRSFKKRSLDRYFSENISFKSLRLKDLVRVLMSQDTQKLISSRCLETVLTIQLQERILTSIG